MLGLTTVVALLALTTLSSCYPNGNYLKYRSNRLNQLSSLSQKTEKPSSEAFASHGWFSNKVDHFDNSNTATFNQQYWFNNQYYQPGGPVFVLLGQNGPENVLWAQEGGIPYILTAKQAGGFIFVLEHRYYGESRPTSDLSTANLAYLSSAQAIEDVNDFINGMKVQFPQLASAKWATYGMAYSGALSAWSRLKHPETVSVAVASSASLLAKVDFTEFMEVAQTAITLSSAGCAQSVSASMALVAQLLQTASGRQTLKSTFNLCQPLDPNDDKMIKTFWDSVYTPYREIVQASRVASGLSGNELTVDNAICRYHNDNSVSYLNKLKEVNNNFNTLSLNIGCLDVSYTSLINSLKETHYGFNAAERAWTWQTCTEFGWFASTDSPTAGPFWGGASTVTAQYYIDQCTDIFGSAYNAASVAAAVAQTNLRYGGANIASDHIILSNGNVDPWYPLGQLTSSISTVVPIMIDGTAHCADMYTAAYTDPTTLPPAKTQISNLVLQWLA